MAQIRQTIQDLLTKISTQDVVNQDTSTVKLYTRVWNNQIKSESDGKLYDFPKPAAFVEVVTPANYDMLGQGYRSSDIAFRIHLCHEYYNNDGTFEQDLLIFDLRDSIIDLLHLYCPPGCGPLTAIREEQDFDHDNIYHYIIDFMCNFIDDAANVDKDFIFSDPPTDLQIDKKPNE